MTLKYGFCTLILTASIYVLNLFILLLSYGSHITIPRSLQSRSSLQFSLSDTVMGYVYYEPPCEEYQVKFWPGFNFVT